MKKNYMFFNQSNIYSEAKKLNFFSLLSENDIEIIIDYIFDTIQKNNVFEELSMKDLSEIQLLKLFKILKEKNHSLKKVKLHSLDFIFNENCLRLFYELLEKHKIFSNLEVLDINFIEGEKIGKLFNMLSEYEKNNVSIRKLVLSRALMLCHENSFNELCNMLTKSKLEKLEFGGHGGWTSIRFHNEKFYEAIRNCRIKGLSFNMGFVYKVDVDYLCSVIDSVKEGKNIKSFELKYKIDRKQQEIFKKLTELVESRRNFDCFDFSLKIDGNEDNEIDEFLNTLSSLTCLTKVELKFNFEINEDRVKALENLVRNNRNLRVLKLKRIDKKHGVKLSFRNLILEIALHESLKKVHLNNCFDVKFRTIYEIISTNRSIEKLKAYIDLNKEQLDVSDILLRIEAALRSNYVITKLDLYDYVGSIKLTSDGIEKELRKNLQLKKCRN
jgi:hypothetical protein